MENTFASAALVPSKNTYLDDYHIDLTCTSLLTSTSGNKRKATEAEPALPQNSTPPKKVKSCTNSNGGI